MKKARTQKISVRHRPEGSESGPSVVTEVAVSEGTTAAQVLGKLGLEQHVLLAQGQFPPVGDRARVLEVARDLDPEFVAMAGGQFVAVARTEAEKVAALTRKFSHLYGKNP